MTEPRKQAPRSGLEETIEAIEAAPYFLVCGACEAVLEKEHKTRWLADEARDRHVEETHADEARVLVLAVSHHHVDRSRDEFLMLVSGGG